MRLVDELHRVTDVDTRRQRGAARSPGWRWPRRRQPARAIGGDLALADRRRPAPGAAPSTRRRRRSTAPRRRARRPATYGCSTVRTDRWARCTWRRWHGSCTATRPRRGLGGPRQHGRMLRRATRARRARGPRTPRPPACRAGGRSPSARPRIRPSRRRSARRRASTAITRRASRLAVVGEPGVHVQRAAAVAAPSGQRHAAPGAAEHPASTAACTCRCHASMTQPVNSHTSLPVGSSGARRSGQLGRGAPRRGSARGGPAGRRRAPANRPAAGR